MLLDEQNFVSLKLKHNNSKRDKMLKLETLQCADYQFTQSYHS